MSESVLMLGVNAVDNGVMLTFAYPHMQVQVLVDDAQWVALRDATNKAISERPKVQLVHTPIVKP